MLVKSKQAILTLMLSTRGSLSLTIEMIETEQDCLRILNQIQIAQANMHRCGQILARYQLLQSLETACFDTCPENRSAELNNIVNLYSYYQEFS